MNNLKPLIQLTVILFFLLNGCSNETTDKAGQTENRSLEITSESQKPSNGEDDLPGTLEQKPLITFIELGSVNCIPCKKMQHDMKSIEKRYAHQIKVIFYDVWKSDQKKYAAEYRIKSIPTQVFLNRVGNEITRHIGFYPESEIDKFLLTQGLTPIEETSSM